MKKSYMLTIMVGLFEGYLFWVGQHDSQTFILEEKLTQWLYNLIQFLSNLSKIIPC